MLLALCLLCFFGEAKAQDAQDVRLGYCIDRLGSCLTCQSGGGESNTLSGAIYLKPEILKKYVGDSIYQMKFAIGTKVGKMVSVFVTKDLEGQPIRSKTVKDFVKGWNTVEFTGVKITESIASSGLYVGYTTYPEETSSINPSSTLRASTAVPKVSTGMSLMAIGTRPMCHRSTVTFLSAPLPKVPTSLRSTWVSIASSTMIW